jgi:hypothetical protein
MCTAGESQPDDDSTGALSVYGLLILVNRMSGVCDHYANDDMHAIQIGRNIIGNLNWSKSAASVGCTKICQLCLHYSNILLIFTSLMFLQVIAPEFDEPLFSAEDMGGIIPKDSKKPFDIRKVPLLLSVQCDVVWCSMVKCSPCELERWSLFELAGS